MSDERLSEDGEGRVDWVRGGRSADLTTVPVDKLQKAAEERGIRIDITHSEPGRLQADVHKVIIEDMPASRPWWKRWLGID